MAASFTSVPSSASSMSPPPSVPSSAPKESKEETRSGAKGTPIPTTSASMAYETSTPIGSGDPELGDRPSLEMAAAGRLFKTWHRPASLHFESDFMQVICMDGASGSSDPIPVSVSLIHRYSDHGFFAALLRSYKLGSRMVELGGEYSRRTVCLFVALCKNPINRERIGTTHAEVEELLALIVSGLPIAPSTVPSSSSTPPHPPPPPHAAAAAASAGSATSASSPTSSLPETSTESSSAAATSESIHVHLHRVLHGTSTDSAGVQHLRRMVAQIYAYWRMLITLPEQLDITLEPLWPHLGTLIQVLPIISAVPFASTLLEMMGIPADDLLTLAESSPSGEPPERAIRECICHALSAKVATWSVKSFAKGGPAMVSVRELGAIKRGVQELVGLTDSSIAQMLFHRLSEMQTVADRAMGTAQKWATRALASGSESGAASAGAGGVGGVVAGGGGGLPVEILAGLHRGHEEEVAGLHRGPEEDRVLTTLSAEDDLSVPSLSDVDPSTTTEHKQSTTTSSPAPALRSSSSSSGPSSSLYSSQSTPPPPIRAPPPATK